MTKYQKNKIFKISPSTMRKDDYYMIHDCDEYDIYKKSFVIHNQYHSDINLFIVIKIPYLCIIHNSEYQSLQLYDFHIDLTNWVLVNKIKDCYGNEIWFYRYYRLIKSKEKIVFTLFDLKLSTIFRYISLQEEQLDLNVYSVFCFNEGKIAEIYQLLMDDDKEREITKT